MALSAGNLISTTHWFTTARTASGITSSAIAVQADDLLVAKCNTEDSPFTPTISDNTAGAVAWSEKAATGAITDREQQKIWTTVIPAGVTSLTVTWGVVGGSSHRGGTVEVWRGAQVASTPATNATKSGGPGAPSATVTTVAPGSVVSWICGDWQTGSGSRTYLSGATEQAQRNIDANIQYECAWQTAASAGAQTIGLSAPTNQWWAMLGIEIQEAAPAQVPKSGAESLSISDAASVRVPVTATESMTIADAGGVGIPTPAADAATIGDQASISAALAAPDVLQVGDALGLSGALAATDGLQLADTSAVGPLGGDELQLADAVSELVARLGVTQPLTLADGAAIETLFADLVIALWAVDPDTGALLALPDVVSLDLSRERNGAGSISLTYPVDGLNFAVLRDSITTNRDLEVEVWTIGSQLGALRGYLQEAAGDDVAEDRSWRFAGGFDELRCDEMVTWPRPIITTTTVTDTVELDTDPKTYQVTKRTTVSSPVGPPTTTTTTTVEDSGYAGTTTDTAQTKGDLEFGAVTPGELMSTLLAEAHDHDVLTDITLGCTATHDSAGTPWPDVITSTFAPDVTYTAVLGRLVDYGVTEWCVTWTGSERRLDMWAPGGRGADLTVGDRPIVLRKARNLLDAPRKWSVRDAGTAVLASGAEGVYEYAEDLDALARRGRKIIRPISAQNFDDHASLQGYAQNQLPLITAGTLEVTHGIAFLPGEPRPLIAFDIGDWVYSQSRPSALERLRVVQWTLTVDQARKASGTVTLNDTVTDALAKLKAQLDGLTQGDTVVGTSTGSGGQDNVPPLPPEILSADSIAFLDGTLGVRAAVTIVWDPPATNVDGSVVTDLDHTTIEYELASSPDVWNAASTAPGTAIRATFAAPAGQTIHIRARAVDRNGNTSVWSDPPYPITTADDDLPPPVPSTPVVSEFLGTIRVTWDGLTTDSAVMHEAALDFDHVEVHLSPGSLFTPSDATLVGRMNGLGTFSITDLPYGTTQYVRLVAVDWSDNKSDPSGQGSATPAQVVSADVFDGAIGTAKLADAAIVTAKIADLAVNDAKIGNLSVGKLTAGELKVDVIVSTGGIATATSGTRVALDSAGLRLYNGANLMVDLKTSNGSALVVGEFRTALSGQRVVFNPGGALPDQLNFYPSAAGDFARIMSRTAPGDGTAAILIDGGAANGTARGRLGAYKSEAFVSYVTNDAGGDTSAGYSRTALSCSTNEVLSWAQTSFGIDKASGGTRINGTRHRLTWVQTSGNWYPCHLSEWNSGIKFDNANLVATSDGTDYIPFHCSTLVEHSSIITKQDVVDINELVDWHAVFERAASYGWRYRTDVARDGDRAFVHFGPLAEDLPEVMHRTTSYGDGTAIGISLDDKVGLLWAAVRELLRRLPESTEQESV